MLYFATFTLHLVFQTRSPPHTCLVFLHWENRVWFILEWCFSRPDDEEEFGGVMAGIMRNFLSVMMANHCP